MLCSHHAALAQTPETRSGEASSGGLEEVVVTAQKRAENLQTVPFSVSAITAQTFERFHFKDLKDLNGSIPNINFTQITNVGLTSALTIRGMGIPNNPDPYTGTEVAVVIDGVVQGTRLLGLTDQFDVERIEVLRGPQGELFGANTLGGVVNIVTRQPTGKFGVYGRLTSGNYGEFDGALAVNFPILQDTLAGKVSMSKRTRDGFFANRFDNQNLMWVDTTSSRASLLWTPSDTLDATLTYQNDRIRNGADAVPNRSLPGEALFRPGTQAINFSIYSDSAQPNRADADAFTLTANWDSPLGKMTSISNYSSFDAHNIQDVDGFPEFILNASRTLKSHQFSQELRTVAKPVDSVELLLGAFYMKLDHKVDTLTLVPGLAPGIFTDQFVHGIETSAAAFSQVYWNITDKLRLGGGLRYSHIKVELESDNLTFFNASMSPTNYPQNLAGATTLGGFNALGSKTWDEPSGKIGLDYKIAPDVMLYGYAARGFKSGGFNGRITDPRDLGPYDPEFVNSFELGVRSDWLNHTLRVNAAAFHNKWTDMQVAQSVYRGTTASSTILNAARATIEGFELELTAIPVSGLTLGATVGYLDAKFDQFSDGTVNFAGRPTPYAPKWTASGNVEYAFTTGSGTTTASVLYAYEGKRWGNYTQAPSELLDSVGLLNANLSWAPANAQWSVALWGRNLMDKKYFSSALDVPPLFTIAAYGAPRQYGVDVTFDF
jgi:iron complex outermembrane receptor protein